MPKTKPLPKKVVETELYSLYDVYHYDKSGFPTKIEKLPKNWRNHEEDYEITNHEIVDHPYGKLDLKFLADLYDRFKDRLCEFEKICFTFTSYQYAYHLPRISGFRMETDAECLARIKKGEQKKKADKRRYDLWKKKDVERKVAQKKKELEKLQKELGLK